LSVSDGRGVDIEEEKRGCWTAGGCINPEFILDHKIPVIDLLHD